MRIKTKLPINFGQLGHWSKAIGATAMGIGLGILVFSNGAFSAELDAKLFDEASSQVFKVGIATSIDGELKGHGTGFVVSSDGFAATAFHVVSDALDIHALKKYRPKIYVVRKGVRVEAAIWAVDSMHDMAIIKLPSSFGKPWKISAGTLEKGASLNLMGYPGDADFAIVNGILQSNSLSEVVPSYQITSPIKEGMSGGPVLSSKGEIVGMILAGASGKGDIALAGQAGPLNELVARAVKRADAPSLVELVDEAHRSQLRLQELEAKLLKKIFQNRSTFYGWTLPSTDIEKSDILCGEYDIEPYEEGTKKVPNRSCRFKMANDSDEVSFEVSYSAIPVRSNQLKTANLVNGFLNEGRRWKISHKKFGKFSCEPDLHLKREDGESFLISVCSRVSNPAMDVFHSVVRVTSLNLSKPGIVGRLSLVGFSNDNSKNLIEMFLKSLEVDREFKPEE